MKKTLYLMRHGETLFNVRGKKQGWCDSPLTKKGENQAKQARVYFESHQIVFDHAYASTSERACDTLELVCDLPYVRCKGLKEWNFGLYEGESETLNPPIPYGDFFVSYGGESQNELRCRMNDTLTSIMNQADHKTVLVVSHGGACMQFLIHHFGMEILETYGPMKNCDIVKLTYEDAGFHLEAVIHPAKEAC